MLLKKALAQLVTALRTIRIAMFPLGFALVASTAFAEGPFVERVVNGNAVSQAYLGVRFEGPARVLVFTNRAGRFTVPKLVPGDYRVTVDKETRGRAFNVRVNGTLSPPALIVRW